jgi:hypothetical protein
MIRRLLTSSLLVLAVACGGAAAPEPAKEPTPAASASAMATAPAQTAPASAAPAETKPQPPEADAPLPVAGPPVVTLIDPGAEPRKALRYKFGKAAETAIMDMQMALAIRGVGPGAREITMPTMRMRFDVKPTNVDRDGTLTTLFEMKKIDMLDDKPVSAEMKEKLTGEFQKMVGLKGRTVVTARGLTQEAAIDVPAGMPQSVQQLIDSMKDSLRNLACPFPEEAVGKNARWEVKTVVTGPLTIVQKATYALKEATDKSVAFDVTIVQEAPPQVMKSAQSLPPGATMRLEQYAGGGSGATKIALDKITPTSALKLTSSSEMQVTAGDQHQKVGIDLAMDLKVKSSK